MRRFIGDFAALLRPDARRPLRIALLISIGFEIAIAAYAVICLPIVRLYPACFGPPTLSSLIIDRENIEGEMAQPFFEAYKSNLPHYAGVFTGAGPRLYVSISDYFDDETVLRASAKAVTRMQHLKRDQDVFGIVWFRHVAYPEFVGAMPGCPELRRAAIRSEE